MASSHNLFYLAAFWVKLRMFAYRASSSHLRGLYSIILLPSFDWASPYQFALKKKKFKHSRVDDIEGGILMDFILPSLALVIAKCFSLRRVYIFEQPQFCFRPRWLHRTCKLHSAEWWVKLLKPLRPWPIEFHCWCGLT